MSISNRAYNLLRGYIGREYERIQGLDRTDAAAELAAAMSQKANPPEAKVTPQSPTDPADRAARARAVLGVSSAADFREVQTAFTRLNKRSDPAKFPADSPEAQQASIIQRRIQQAYRILTEKMDATEVRFQSLEIE